MKYKITVTNLSEMIKRFENSIKSVSMFLTDEGGKEVPNLIIESAEDYVPEKTGKLISTPNPLFEQKGDVITSGVLWSAYGPVQGTEKMEGGPIVIDYAYVQEVRVYGHLNKPAIRGQAAQYAERGIEGSQYEIFDLIAEGLNNILRGM